MLRFVAVVIATLCLVACASSGTNVDPAKVQSFQRGKTTYAEVIETLGAPQADVLSDDGSRVVVYSYAQARARAVDFVPYVGLLAGGADAKVSGYSFTFDRSGLLVTETSVNGRNSVNTGILNGN